MKGKKVLTLGFLLVFSFVAINCNAQSSTSDQRIVGTWITEDGFTIVFNANGSGSYSGGGEGTFTYGVSIDGELFSTIRDFNGKIYFSPDGRTVFLRGFSTEPFRKR